MHLKEEFSEMVERAQKGMKQKKTQEINLCDDSEEDDGSYEEESEEEEEEPKPLDDPELNEKQKKMARWRMKQKSKR